MGAFLNSLMEEGTKEDCFRWVVKLDAENDKLRRALGRAADCLDACAAPTAAEQARSVLKE